VNRETYLTNLVASIEALIRETPQGERGTVTNALITGVYGALDTTRPKPQVHRWLEVGASLTGTFHRIAGDDKMAVMRTADGDTVFSIAPQDLAAKLAYIAPGTMVTIRYEGHAAGANGLPRSIKLFSVVPA
jgi:hypothetical protein